MKCYFEIIIKKGEYIITEKKYGNNFFYNGCLSLYDLPVLDYINDRNNHIKLMDVLNIFLNNQSIDMYKDTYGLCFQSYCDNTFPKFMYNFNNLYSITMTGGRMWSLKIADTPTTVESLDIIDCGNLNDIFICLFETNLKEIFVNMEDVYYEIIPASTNLQKINIFIANKLSKYYHDDFLIFLKDLPFLNEISEEIISINICDNNQDYYYFSYSDLFNYKISQENLPLFENLKNDNIYGMFTITVTLLSKIKKDIELLVCLINKEIIGIDIATNILNYIFDFGEKSIDIGKYFINVSIDQDYEHSVYNCTIEQYNRHNYIMAKK